MQLHLSPSRALDNLCPSSHLCMMSVPFSLPLLTLHYLTGVTTQRVVGRKKNKMMKLFFRLCYYLLFGISCVPNHGTSMLQK